MNDLKVIKEHVYNDFLEHVVLYLDSVRLDIALSQYSGDEMIKDLLFAWPGLEVDHETEYLWNVIDMKKDLNIPILVCEDDADLSCLVLVVNVRYTDKLVFWDKFGLWKRSHHPKRFKSEFEAGIIDFESWSDEQWALYGDKLDTFNLEDVSWKNWISKNWKEESILRIWKYTHVILNIDENIDWIDGIPAFCFEKESYEACIEEVRKYKDLL